jgi:hypothetical protein
MNKNTSPEVLNSCSGNLKSKIENLKWLGDPAERARESGSGDSVSGIIRTEAITGF